MKALNPDVTTTDDVDAALKAEVLQPLPRKRGEPVFQDSWEAEAFAIGNILVKEGYLSCKEWMDLMAAAIRQAQANGDPDYGDTYYQHWCSSLESFCFANNWVSPETYQSLLSQWGLAIARTPHGVPLALENAHVVTYSSDVDASNTPSEHSHGHDHSHQHHDVGVPPEHYWTPAHITRLNSGHPCD